MSGLDAPTADLPRHPVTTVPRPPARRVAAPPSCGVLSPGLGLICTVHAGHRGEHAAHGVDGRIITSWDDG